MTLALAFDPTASLVAASPFMAGIHKIEAGDAFDWRALGLAEHDAMTLFSAGLVTAATVPASAPELEAAADVQTSAQPPVSAAQASPASAPRREHRRDRR